MTALIDRREFLAIGAAAASTAAFELFTPERADALVPPAVLVGGTILDSLNPLGAAVLTGGAVLLGVTVAKTAQDHMNTVKEYAPVVEYLLNKYADSEIDGAKRTVETLSNWASAAVDAAKTGLYNGGLAIKSFTDDVVSGLGNFWNWVIGGNSAKPTLLLNGKPAITVVYGATDSELMGLMPVFNPNSSAWTNGLGKKSPAYVCDGSAMYYGASDTKDDYHPAFILAGSFPFEFEYNGKVFSDRRIVTFQTISSDLRPYSRFWFGTSHASTANFSGVSYNASDYGKALLMGRDYVYVNGALHVGDKWQAFSDKIIYMSLASGYGVLGNSEHNLKGLNYFSERALVAIYTYPNSLSAWLDFATHTIFFANGVNADNYLLGFDRVIDGGSNDWTVVTDKPHDLVINGSSLVGHDMVVDGDQVTDRGSISIPDVLGGTFGEVLTGSRVGVLSQPVTDATIPVSTPVVAGTVENGAVVTTTGSIQALRGKVDSAGQSTTATSISASFPMDALTTPSISLVWPFSIPWDLDRFFSTVLPEPSFPDEIDIPFVTGYLPDMTMKLDTSMIKRLHDIIRPAAIIGYIGLGLVGIRKYLSERD